MPRVWLVGRDVDDRDLVTLTYATTDGELAFTRQLSADALHRRSSGPTAAVDVDDERLDPVDDADTRERYAQEAARMAESHDPDDEV